MFLNQFIDLLGELAFETSFFIFIQETQSAVDNFEVMRVVNLFLLKSGLRNLGPQLLIVVLNFNEFVCQSKNHSLIHHYFAAPFLQHDLLETIVQQVDHVRAFCVTVVAEGLQELVDLLCVHAVEVVLQFTGPPVHAETRALISLVVGPESAEAVTGFQVVRTSSFVRFLELLENQWVEDFSLD